MPKTVLSTKQFMTTTPTQVNSNLPYNCAYKTISVKPTLAIVKLTLATVKLTLATVKLMLATVKLTLNNHNTYLILTYPSSV